MLLILTVIIGLFIGFFLLFSREFIRAATIKEHFDKLMSPKESMHRLVVTGFSKEISCIQEILKQKPSDNLYLVHNDTTSEKYSMYALNSYDAILYAAQLFHDYHKRDRFKIYS